MQMEMCCLHLPSLYLQSAMGSGWCGERGWHLRTTTNNTSQLILYMFGRIFFSLSTYHHDPSPNVASYILFLCRSGVDACKQIQTNDMYAVMQLWQMTHSGICYPKNQTKTKKIKTSCDLYAAITKISALIHEIWEGTWRKRGQKGGCFSLMERGQWAW